MMVSLTEDFSLALFYAGVFFFFLMRTKLPIFFRAFFHDKCGKFGRGILIVSYHFAVCLHVPHFFIAFLRCISGP